VVCLTCMLWQLLFLNCRSSNSGCYFVKSNPRTIYFFSSMLHMGDILLSCKSHQAMTNLLLNRMESRYGLRIKNLQAENELIPSKPVRRAILYRCQWDDYTLTIIFPPFSHVPVGYHFNRDHNFMKRLISSNKTSSLSLHYNWNTNKVVKRQLLEQMGDWYVQDVCLPMKEQQNTTLNMAVCCAAQPLIRCHYSDLPSVIRCPDSPSFNSDKARKFWSRR